MSVGAKNCIKMNEEIQVYYVLSSGVVNSTEIKKDVTDCVRKSHPKAEIMSVSEINLISQCVSGFLFCANVVISGQ